MKTTTDIKKILVVDDESDIRTYLSKLLKENGYEVMCASDGNEAFKKINEEEPALILLDMAMPHKSGVKFYREIKSDSKLSKIPVVVVTAVTGFGGSSDDFKKFLSTRRQVPPPDEFIPKPIDQKEILSAISKLT